MNLAAHLAILLPEPLRSAPPPSLIPDAGPSLLARSRRREDCALLTSCELLWIYEHGDAAAMCPATCLDYRRRDR